MDLLLKVDKVTKKYGQFTALNQVSLHVPKGSIYGLLGPNGAGKTSLIRIINQITMPDSGQVVFDGEILNPSHISQIGYLPEERGLYKSMKVGEQCLYLARLKGLSKQEAKKQLDYWFETFDIKEWWHKKIEELSKGMAQKVQFIACVLHQPKLLIFDEPFSGFDPVNALLIKDQILELKKKGATIIFSTHRMESVEELCDDIALIHKSNKLIEGNLNEVKKQHKTNSYEVGILPKDKSNALTFINQNFETTTTNFKSIHGDKELKFDINLDTKTANDVLNNLIELGQITRFVEKIPSVNDIFIQTVS